MAAVTVLLANDHPIIRSGLRVILERERDLRVVAEAANGREAVVLAEYKRPDIILLDVSLPYVNGMAAAREISQKDRHAGIIFVGEHTDEAYVSEAFKAGARGYVSADAVQTDLVQAIRTVMAGDPFVSPGCMQPGRVNRDLPTRSA